MAASLRTNLSLHSLYPSTTQGTIHRPNFYIRCGRRDNRGPLLKGRILSTEAIQAVQSLKRLHRTNPALLTDSHLSKTLSRLIKSDLVAALRELLRQGHCDIAAKAFSAVRSEHRSELSLCADLVAALGREGLNGEIDDVIVALEQEEEEGVIEYDDKGLVKLVRALIDANRAELTVRIYRMLKSGGWGSGSEMDENVGKALIKGLRRMGEERLADEIEAELRTCEGILDKSLVEQRSS